jgi:aminoglycoside 3-N-acetyltransferase
LVKQGDIVLALRGAGLQKGDIVFVHSRLFTIGLLGDVLGPLEIPGTYVRAFLEVLGESGTLIVPTYTTSFGRYGKPFVFEESPSEMGLFSETVRKSPGAYRSLHPIYSVAGLGARAAEFMEDHPRWNVGYDTVWDRMHQRGGKVVAVGLPLRQCLSFIHHVEYLACVPYMYPKLL